MYTRDTINNWASLDFGGKNFTEKKKNYFSNKVQEKKVNRTFKMGKKTRHQKQKQTQKHQNHFSASLVSSY